MRGIRVAKSIVPSLVWRVRSLLCLVAMLLCCCESVSPALATPPKGRSSLQRIQELHRKRFREFTEEIKKLALDCDQKGLTDDADEVRSRIFDLDAQSFRIKKLPTDVRPEIPPNTSGDEHRSWQKRLRHLESDYAKDLYTQSRSALRQGFPSYAYNLIREAALHDPDNIQVRKVLGFVRQKNEWVTPFAAAQMKDGKIWHDDFGWLQNAHVKKYIAGERYYNKGWISAEKEKELRRDFNSAWEVRTDHYLIKTNVSLEKGVEMGKALEEFYSVFNETFAGFFHSAEQLQKLFDGSSNMVRADARPFTVHFYRARDEYLNRMRKFFPSIDRTNGVYLTSDRVAHFYLDPDQDNDGTLFHEATHQLFFESHQENRTICENHHFWIIEGIACYMESFQRKAGAFTLGNPNHIRFRGARHNLLTENYYVPLEQFTSYGMTEFQGAPDLVKNYTQASGLARFFMHYDNGRYREALVKHLSQLYSNNQRLREQPESLETLTGVEFTELDRQYAEDARETEGLPIRN